MFLRGQHDFKIQLPLYFLQPDWLIQLFPSNLKMISYPLSLWGFVGRPWDFGSAVILLGIQMNLNSQITRKSWRNMDKNSKYWGFMEQNEAIKDTVQHWCW